MKLFLLILTVMLTMSSCSTNSVEENGQKKEVEQTTSTVEEKPNAGDPWLPSQLMEPEVLALRMQAADAMPYVFNIGPSGKIAGSILIGPTQDAENLSRLKSELSKLSKDTEVVVYCGCCPFKNCPNIRPDMQMLDDMNFEHAYLLNLSENLKVDWIDKGYPME
jgi:hypothetical protein